jgi:chorismate mutase-like protein
MAYRFLKGLVFCFILCIGGQHMAHANLSDQEIQSVSKLFSLLNDRFSLQKDVAIYKHSTNMPTFVPSREQQVLADVAVITKAQHLDLQSVQAFIDTQLRISVNLQIQWRRVFKREDFVSDSPVIDLEQSLRPELSRLTNEIVQQIGSSVDIINEPANFQEIKTLFEEIIDAELITPVQQEALLSALLRIKKA